MGGHTLCCWLLLLLILVLILLLVLLLVLLLFALLAAAGGLLSHQTGELQPLNVTRGQWLHSLHNAQPPRGSSHKVHVT